jgi:hypothetical protein
MPLVELTALVLAAALLVAARRQRVKARRRKRLLLRRALASPDPAVRRAAVQVAGDEGLSRSADVFLDLLRRERDASVLATLAQVVVRNQWEPADAPTLLQLRLWAHRYLDAAREDERRTLTRPHRNGYQGPSVGEVVNLLLQPPDKRAKGGSGGRPPPAGTPWG